MCTCQLCGRRYKIDLIVPDELWEKIKPAGKKKGAGMLCPICIISDIERVIVDEVGYGAFTLISHDPSVL